MKIFETENVMIRVVKIIGINTIISLNKFDEIIIKIVLVIVSRIIMIDIVSIIIYCLIIEKLLEDFIINRISIDVNVII